MRMLTVGSLGLAAAIVLTGAGSAQDGVGSGDATVLIVRSARMSYLEGDVTVRQEGAKEGVPAQPNMALSQGSTIITGEKGQAEVEFEDGSVVRLTPNSGLVLSELRTDSDGQGTMTVMQVGRGLVYLELRAAGVARFRVVAGADSFWPMENATVRVNLDAPPATIAVLDGRIHLEHQEKGTRETDGPLVQDGFKTEVRAGESLKSDLSDGSRYFLSEGIAQESWDHWNESQDQAAADALEQGTGVRQEFAGTKGYGWSDLDASGSWYQGSDQTPIWQPEEALQVGFDPYGYGSWSYFPGAGYTWASGYGWGWTPYRCGRWQYWDGFGWGWQPDGFCGTAWRFGGSVNVYRGPRGYIPIGVPIRPRPGVHPIIPGPHPAPIQGGRTVFERRRGDDREERKIAGVVVRPIRPAGYGSTPHGGSAVGSALRRDYPVDARTHGPVFGTTGDALGRRQGSGETMGLHSVSARPEAPLNRIDEGAHGSFLRGAAPTRTDRGDQDRVPVRHGPDAVQSRAMRPSGDAVERSTPVTVGPGRGVERSEPVSRQTVRQFGDRPQRGEQAAPRMESQRSAPAPRMEQRSSPAPAPAVRSAPAAPASSSHPAASSPK